MPETVVTSADAEDPARPALDVDLVIPTIGRSSLVSLLEALDRSRGPLPRRIVVVDDRPAGRTGHRGDRPGAAETGPGAGGTGPGADRRPWGDWTPTHLDGRLVALSCGGRGPAAARNVGWLAGDAEWVAFLDDDVLPGPGWLEALAADLAAAEPEAGGVQGRIRVPLPGDRRPTDWERNVRLLERARWATADMAYRRAALAAVGGFDQRFPRAYREDSDLAIRVELAGWRLTMGRRCVEHPVRPAGFWTSVRVQRGNADDVLMRALHGDWEGLRAPRGRRPWHLATSAAALGAAAGLALGRPRLAAASGALWLGATARFAWERIQPGPRTPAEVARMVATSVAVPPAASFWWLAGLARRRRLLAAGPELGAEPDPTARPGASAARPAGPEEDRSLAPLPREIQLEVTGTCNLKCRMCLVRYRPVLPRVEGSMTFETFRRIVDDLPDLAAVTLQGLGEPLLAPDLFRMIEYASARGVRMGFNTNATLLTRERAERLVRAGLDWLHVSVDGATAITYEGIRDGASFERVRRGVDGLVQVMRELGSDRPALTLVFVAMRRNLAELPDVVALAAEWGIPRVHVQNLSHSFDDTGATPEYQEIRRYTAAEALWTGPVAGSPGGPDPEAERTFARAREVAGELGVSLRLPRLEEPERPRRPGTPGCSWPWEKAYVTHEGKVQPCCMVMGEDRAVLGDAAGDGFAAVWSNEAYREFRSALLTDEPPEVCRGCSMYRGVF